MVPFLSYSVFFTSHHITLKWCFPPPVPPYAPLHVLYIIRGPSYLFSFWKKKKKKSFSSMVCFWPFSFGPYLFCYLPNFTELPFVKDCQLIRQMSMPLAPALFSLAWKKSRSGWESSYRMMAYGWCGFHWQLEKQMLGSERPWAGRVTLHSSTVIFGKVS